MTIEFLKGKKIGIIGHGVNHKNLTSYFDNHSINYEIVEGWKTADELTGRLLDFEVVFRTPGLPFLSKAVQEAIKNGVVVYSQTKLFFDLCPCPIIAVTGTKGKGTTSTLIYEILNKAGKKTWLAGNVGKDPFEFLDEITPGDFTVLELSSFQIQDLHKGPHIAVVLSITSDHLDHHKDVAEYLSAKQQLILNQTANDFAVLNPNLPPEFYGEAKSKKVFFEPSSVADFERKILGDHNLENIAAATEVAKILQVGEQTVRAAVKAFEGLSHRLKPIRTVNGVTFVDDSISTNIDSTAAAIEAFNTPLILILGGSDKGLDYTPLADKIKSNGNIKGVVVIGAVSEKIISGLQEFNGKILNGARNMKDAVEQANNLSANGDTVLLSPAAASFDMFKNAYDRGEQFIEAVNRL